MTYCLGLRTARGVLIAADSAISSMGHVLSACSGEGTTTFGELQGNVGRGRWSHIEEAVLKLTVEADSVIGFAGDVDTGRCLIDLYLTLRMDAGSNGRDAVRKALSSVYPCQEQAEALFGFYDANEPYLMHVDIARGTVSEVEGLVQVGSVPQSQCTWTARYVSKFLAMLERLGPDPRQLDQVFAQLVALVQSYGVHDYLLPEGVGGAFVAAWVTPTGAQWQRDHLDVMHDTVPTSGEIVMCATMVRDGVLCLVNNQTGSSKLITWPGWRESEQAVSARI